MVDVTNLPYRMICKKYGASMVYVEMLYVDAVIHENKRTFELMKTVKEERPVGVQVTGSNVEHFKKALKYFDNYDLVDINCGCPSIRIVGNSAGSFLLKSPEKIGKIIEVLKDNGFTATAKIRLGFETNNVLKVSKIIEKAGADALTVHGRLASHGTSIPADWKWIGKVKKNIGIPVIGNGDISNGKQAEEMLEICDGAMIARAAIGNPLIFRNILDYLKTGKEKETSAKERINSFQEYLKLCKKYKLTEISRIKHLGCNFFKDFEGASKKRGELMNLKSFEDIEEFGKNVI
jgi:nifR3 family TIM-barrel protein